MPIYIDFGSPFNQSVLAFLGITDVQAAVSYTPKEVNYYQLGTHPDLVEYLWKLGASAALGCACVINQRSSPLLAHPVTGIIFGLAGGTSTLALRLPEPERSASLAKPGYGAEYRYPQTTIYARDIGKDWALLEPYAKGNDALCASAYAYAGTLTTMKDK